MASKTFQGIEIIVLANFMISVLLLITGSLSSLSEHYSLFEFNQELYGELVSNIKITMIYIAFTEMIICGYCLFMKKSQVFVLIGFFLILMVGSLHFYGEINDVEIDENLSLFFLYTGVSHILFGVISNLDKSYTSSVKS